MGSWQFGAGMNQALICAAVRTPFGRFDGELSDFLKCGGIMVFNLMGLEISPELRRVIMGSNWREVETP